MQGGNPAIAYAPGSSGISRQEGAFSKDTFKFPAASQKGAEPQAESRKTISEYIDRIRKSQDDDFSFSVSPSQLEQEYKAVEDRHKGTDQWLKAPNGENELSRR